VKERNEPVIVPRKSFLRRITSCQLVLLLAGTQLFGCGMILWTSLPIVRKFPAPTASEQLRKEQIAMEDVLVPLGIIVPICFAVTSGCLLLVAREMGRKQ
jgi:hypothetical protein